MIQAHTLISLVSDFISPKAGAAAAGYTGSRPSAYNASSKFVQLTEDVLLIIVEYLSPMDRAHLLRTCRYLHSILEVAQYRRLDMTSTWLYHRTDRLHRTLSGRPDLISCMICYSGPFLPYILSKPTKLSVAERLKLRLRGSTAPLPQWDDTPFAETERRAIFIFTKAVNIRELEFTDRPCWGSNSAWRVVKANLPKMSLTRLSIPIVAVSVEVVPLLRTQPGLEELDLPRVPGRLGSLKETDIPKLKSLRATLKDAAIVVPSRPVEEFCHVLETGEHTLDEEGVRKLSLSSTPITKLTARLHHPLLYDSVRSSLHVFARHLPEIEHLTLVVGGAVSGQLLLDEIPLFRSLRTVKFLDAILVDESHPGVPIGWANDGDQVAVPIADTIEWDSLRRRLQEKCPSLVDLKYTP